MQIIIVGNKFVGGQKGYSVFQKALINGDHNFGLATGGTPETTYQQIRHSSLNFTQCISINLDEYVGLSRNNPNSYHYYMKKHLFNQKPFAYSYLLNGLAKNENKEVKRYERLIASHPIDLQLLGIGRDGHIGFNEPGSSFSETTHKVKLSLSTLKANARFFGNQSQVPRYAYSMGIGDIMKSKKILLEAFGKKKAWAIAKTLKGPITRKVPASILQKHPHVLVIIDKQAASLLGEH